MEKGHSEKIWRRARRKLLSDRENRLCGLASGSQSKKGGEFLKLKGDLRWAT